jgi:FkbM family methyltransferase
VKTLDISTRYGPMRVIEDDIWISRCLRELGEHSEAEVRFMRFVLGLQTSGRFDGVVVDAGAYIGDLTIPLSRMAREVYAFEPHARTREILQHNLDINGCGNVTVLPYALGESCGDVTYRDVWLENGKESPGSTQMGDPSGECVAEMRTLDSLGITPTFIKADIEGLEIPFLSGALETLRSTRSPLFLERDTVINPEMKPLSEILEILGYEQYPMDFPMWSPTNFNKSTVNTFGSTVAHMVLAVPRKGGVIPIG